MEKKCEDFVNVSVRIRPILNQEQSTPSLQIISKDPPVLLVLDRSQTYNFDNIFCEDVDQVQVYNDTVRNFVDHVKRGYNCTVFAYGQTGTGKTYTMGTNSQVKNQNEYGLITRTLDDFFSCEDEDCETDIYVSFIEIYNEKVFDLLQNNNTVPLLVKGFHVQGFTKERVFNSYEAKHFLEMGNKKRHTGETKQNVNSSRSHAIFTIYCNNRNSTSETSAKLNLVDLAGSESVKKTGTRGSSFHEGVNINKGLLCIGQVMTALSSNSAHVPYRQSIVTTILQDSLNKKNFVSLIACVSPNAEDTTETIQTLEFAHRVKRMKNKPEVNAVITQYKKDNPSLFVNQKMSHTPFKRPNPFQTPCNTKRNKQLLPLAGINESGGVNSTATDSPKSLFSMSSSSVSSEAQQQILSPVIKKYMTAMEASLMEKLQTVIENTMKRPSRVSVLKQMEKENTPESPKFSWSKIQTEVSKMIRSEIQQFSVQSNRAASSPIISECHDNIRKVLTYDSPVLDLNEEKCFKVPELPTIKFKHNKGQPVRRSTRLSLKVKKSAGDLETSDISLCSSLTFKPRSKKIAPLNNNTVSSNESLSNDFEPTELNLNTTVSIDSIHNDSNNDFTSPKKVVNTRRSVRIKQKGAFPTKLQTPLKKIKRGDKKKYSPYTAHSKGVLTVLNSGNLKQLEKLHSVGAKTAEQIHMYHQLNGSFKRFNDLSNLPGWSEKKLDRFLLLNFLRKD